MKFNDFSRGRQGHVLMGDFLDDGGMPFLSITALLAFLNVGDYESMVFARWGASKWVQCQPRIAAVNAYSADTFKVHGRTQGDSKTY